LKYNILEANSFTLRNKPIQIQSSKITVHDFEVLHGFVLHHIVAKAHSTIVQLINYEIYLFVKDIVPKPLIVIRVVMPHVDVHFICKLNNFVVAVWIHVAWFEVIV
jgi:hypothetical protein